MMDYIYLPDALQRPGLSRGPLVVYWNQSIIDVVGAVIVLDSIAVVPSLTPVNTAALLGTDSVQVLH